MSLFRKKAPEAPVVVDEFCRNAAAHAALAAAEAGDAAAVRAALAGSTGDERTLVVDAVGDRFPLDAALAWTADEPGAADAWLVRGFAEGRAAAQARGHGTAETLNTAQVLDFEQLMADSRRSAERAAELDAADPAPVHQLIRTCYARGVDELEPLFHELRRREPWHVYGLCSVIDLLGEKWYGARGEARGLAEELAADAPEGSLAPAVVPHAVREQWLYFGAFEKNKAAAVGYITAQETKDAVDAAYDKSVGSPAHQPTALTPYVRNVFALTYELGGRRDRVREQMDALDGLVTPYPWRIIGDPATAYAKARAGAR